ncbi:MAG TPA: sugar phosphate nucleotidyltransferase [Ignavibacteria bacterium]|nr:sugar phosphate nucleotidyltransferase [Ignavibacteria bacterium]
MEKNISTVIMAAGQGKRMKNPDRSKVMHELNGKPLIEYVIELSLKIDSEMIIPVVGHQKNSVIDFINEKFSSEKDKLRFAHQDEQLGTGHAVMQTENFLKDFEGDILILSGDVPLLSYETVRDFLDFHNSNKFDASLISAVMEDPSGYGRVLRNETGSFYDIREEKDCSPAEKKCREINSGIYIIDNQLLFEALKTLKTDNAQGEYYLTDIFRYFKNTGKKIGAFPVKDILEITGINSPEQLQELEKNIVI